MKCILYVRITVASCVDSNEYTEHTIIIHKTEKTSLNYIHLPPDLVLLLTLSGSNYQYLEQVYMVPKIFELLRFDCIYIPEDCLVI